MKVNTLFVVFIIGLVTVSYTSFSCSKPENKNEDPQDTIPKETIISFGTKKVPTTKYTSKGVPVVPMWDYKMPTSNLADGAGFDKLTGAEHSLVWQPATREEGAFNHFVALTRFNNKMYLMWGNHPHGEDAPGQQILMSTSNEWGQWSKPVVLFEPPCPVVPEAEEGNGPHLTPDRWVVIEGKLYAVVYNFRPNSWNYPLFREVNSDGSFGTPFLMKSLPTGAELPDFMKDQPDAKIVPAFADKIQEWYKDNDQISWWANAHDGIQRPGAGGEPLIESFIYRAKDNGLVLFLRCHGWPQSPTHNNRLYVSFNSGSGGWTTPYPTDIPDAPSRTEAVTAADGTIYLIGNQIAYEFDKPLYLNRDPITISISKDGYKFEKTYALRTGAPKTYRFPGVARRNPGFAYSSSLIHDGWLYTAYSVGKEEIGISRVQLADLKL